ncbi:MAG: hypothetical protein M5U26_25415 [Planctomycetota bacterium]|nr:hypothetical protein [Planctomycetota bacterium]
MPTLRFAAVLMLAGCAVWARAEEDATHPADLIVHEWGTFTTMQGSDGVTLEGLHHDEEQLPKFVYDREKLDAEHENMKMYARLKMETPVTYFYTPKPLDIRVKVRFPGGILTQWFPNALSFEPGIAEPGQPGPALKDGVLDWGRVHLEPPGGPPPELPEVAPDDPWTFARQTDSAFVSVRNPYGVGSPFEYEKYLFYRGLGNLELPLVLTTQPGGGVSLRNRGRLPLRELFVLRVEDGKAAFRRVTALEPGARAKLTVELGVDAAAVEAVAAALGAELEQTLTGLGLYPKESRAMVATWTRSYFHTPGLRVLYALPLETTEALLPLEVQPAPRECVRVLIARAEGLTPEGESRVRDLVAALDAESFEARDTARQGLEALGRFAEPQLRRALATSAQPELQARVRALLERFGARR